MPDKRSDITFSGKGSATWISSSRGGGGRRRPPVAPSDYPEDEDEEPNLMIQQIQAILDDDSLPFFQKKLEIQYLVGMKRRRRDR